MTFMLYVHLMVMVEFSIRHELTYLLHYDIILGTSCIR